MANYDPNTGLPVPARRKRGGGRVVLLVLLLVLLCALGFGTGVLLRELGRIRIVPRGERVPVYSAALSPERSAPAGEPEVRAGEELSAADIYALVTPSCVGVTTSTTSANVFGQVTRGAISGSGFLISDDGYILTNNHVIETALEQNLPVRVMLYSGEEYTAEIVGGDSASDVALLKIRGSGFPHVTLGSFGNTRVGEQIYAIGNPLGELTYSMTGGIVSALDRTIPITSSTVLDMFQIDAAINNGNSGGPVVNRFGQVIGIASAKYSSSGVEGLGFAIPIDDALKVVDDLTAYGYVRGRPWLGIVVGNASAYGYDPGGIVMEVTPGSAAEEAGLLTGDIITSAGGIEITGVADLLKAKKNWRAGDTIRMVILREGEARTITLTLDEEKPEGR